MVDRVKSSNGLRFRSINHQLSTINSSRSQGVISSARRSAKAEVRGASPRESARLRALRYGAASQHGNAHVPQHLQDGFRKPTFVGASPTGGPIYGDHDVIAASRPVKAFVPV